MPGVTSINVANNGIDKAEKSKTWCKTSESPYLLVWPRKLREKGLLK